MKTRTLYLSVLFFLMVGFLTGCAASRKISSDIKETTKVEEKRTEAVTGEITTVVDTTKKEGLEITYAKIEFYPPEATASEIINDEGSTKDSGKAMKTGKEPIPKVKEPPNKRGAVKSIEKYTIKQNKEATGFTHDTEKTETTKAEEINTGTKKDEVVTEQPAPDPYRWRYILAIIIIALVAGAAAYFCLRKTKVVTTIISFIRNIFCS